MRHFMFRDTSAKILAMKISAVIIAGNEEAKIGDAIRSVEWADEVLVIDSESTDRTREIAEGLGARVIVRPWPGFSAQKQFGVDQAEHNWILSLDADERISPGLKQEILNIKNSSSQHSDGYKIPRLAYYMGRPIRHCGWYPDWQLRLFDRRKGSWKDVLVHESVSMQAGAVVKKLSNEIIHLTFDSTQEHKDMIDSRYAPLAARQMFANGRGTSRLKKAAAAPVAFVSAYFLRLGFLDGAAGYHISRLAAYHARRKHELLRDLQNGRE
jgi:glycosyltransferase involved in cell wall biosynthesis